MPRARRRDRRSRDDARRVTLAQRLQRDAHRRAGRDAVVDDDRNAPLDRQRRRGTAIQRLAAMQFDRLARDHIGELRVGHAHRAEHRTLQMNRTARRDRAHRELGIGRHAELAYDQHVERRVQRAGDRIRDGHAAARQREHDDIAAARIIAQRVGQPAAGIGAIGKTLEHVRLPAVAPDARNPRRRLSTSMVHRRRRCKQGHTGARGTEGKGQRPPACRYSRQNDCV
ncbi:hypothetical protein C7S15_1711 [Burkholderia cepacia]|nr:hypothetical protein [Burkholderia cepacia]